MAFNRIRQPLVVLYFVKDQGLGLPPLLARYAKEGSWRFTCEIFVNRSCKPLARLAFSMGCPLQTAPEVVGLET